SHHPRRFVPGSLIAGGHRPRSRRASHDPTHSPSASSMPLAFAVRDLPQCAPCRVARPSPEEQGANSVQQRHPTRPEHVMFPVVACAIVASIAQADESATSIAALRTGFDQWQREVSFRSTFQVKKGRAKTIELGLRNGPDDGFELAFNAVGMFIKKADA